MSPRVLDLQIPSRSTAGRMYNVRVSPSDVTCECTGYVMRRRCAHATAARRIFDDPVSAALSFLHIIAEERIRARDESQAAKRALRVLSGRASA